MDVTELRPGLYRLTFGFGQAYLCWDAGTLTLIDTGPAGQGADIAAAITSIGLRPRDLSRIILTHYHDDHAGSAAEIRSWGESAGRDRVPVLAGRPDAPVVRGEVPAPPPVLDGAPEWEQALYRDRPVLPKAPPVAVDRELADGDEIGFAGGATVVAVPGHTAGSIAIYLPGPQVLFTGDAAASVNGRAIPGVFNVDRPGAVAAFQRLARLDAEVACFGHGEPIVGGAAAVLRRGSLDFKSS